MSDTTEKPIADHDYDGIQEYDNPLPTWWLVTFFATIIFGFHYWLHYEFGGGATQTALLEDEMARVRKMQDEHHPEKDSEGELQKLAGAAGVMQKGRDIFGAKCAVCHGPQLQGLIGPNLTDEYWIHGKGTMVDIASVIRSGVMDKGMPAWEGQLQNEEIRALAVFVASQIGSHPPNPKPPQGEKIGALGSN